MSLSFQGTFMSVVLNEGRVQYEVHYKHTNPIVLRTKQKYNTGKKVKVSIAKTYSNKADTAYMKVEMEDQKETEEKTKTGIPPSAILKIKKTKFYFGGVPPDYLVYNANITKTIHTHASLLGVLEDVISHQAIALVDNGDKNKGYYGVIETKCDEVNCKKPIATGNSQHLFF